MRISFASLVLIDRQRQHETEYLSYWSDRDQSLHLLGGSKLAQKLTLEGMQSQLCEQLGLLPESDLMLQPEQLARLSYQAFSEQSQRETSFQVGVFQALTTESGQTKIHTNPHLFWLSASEIEQGISNFGMTIHSTVALVLDKCGRLPVHRDPSVLTIGVTGHRNLRKKEVPRIEHKLEAFFNQAQKMAQGRPITLLSPLAEGADQLVADIALTRHCRLVSPLPLPLSDYEQNFSAPILRQFHHLLARSDEWFTLPPAAQNMPPEKARSQGYERMRRYLVDRSDLLLAIWDGQLNPARKGGTAATMHYALKRKPPQTPPLHINLISVGRSITPEG